MRLACSTLPFRKQPLSEALQKLASLGVRHAELCVDPRHSDPSRWNQTPQIIFRLVHRLGISVNSIHVPLPQVPLETSMETLRQISTDISQKTVELAAFFGAQFVVQHVGFTVNSVDMAHPSIRDHTIPDLMAITSYCAAQGIQLALENVPTSVNRMLGINAKELRDLLNLFPPETVGLCLDVTHCMASGFDPLEALDAIDFLRLMSIHASDNFKNQRIDQHLALGTGDFPWHQFFEKLKSKKYRGCLVMEVADSTAGDNSLSDSLHYLEKFDLST
ncbi:MAG: sugar phosphate isomerase/epimerase [Deltaproteobacteria bacterium]|nr:MAG: sugar phosphate isomerase/epimerase [Deltaproteobacteria bacterium]